jgi:hypothetical protein
MSKVFNFGALLVGLAVLAASCTFIPALEHGENRFAAYQLLENRLFRSSELSNVVWLMKSGPDLLP